MGARPRKIPKNSEMRKEQWSGHLFCASSQPTNALRVAVFSSFPGGRWQSSLFAYPLFSGEYVPFSVWIYTCDQRHTSRHTLSASDCPNRPSPIGYQGAAGGNNRLPIGPTCLYNNYVLPICFRASTQRHNASTEQSPPTPLPH